MDNKIKKLFDKIFYIENKTLRLSLESVQFLLRYKIPIRLWYKYIPAYNMGKSMTILIANMNNETIAKNKKERIKYCISFAELDTVFCPITAHHSRFHFDSKKAMRRFIKDRYGKVKIEKARFGNEYYVYKDDALLLGYTHYKK